MSTTTTGNIVQTLLPGFERTLGLAEAIVSGIDASKFARTPESAPTMNHPAFVIGHLSIYPDRALAMIGKEDAAKPMPGYEELFNPGARCQDDPDGTIYPAMDEIVAHFTERYHALKDHLASVTDETMLSEMPNEKFRHVFPTTGSGVSFLTGSHLMFHLGQISSWRRAMGLGSAIPHMGD